MLAHLWVRMALPRTHNSHIFCEKRFWVHLLAELSVDDIPTSNPSSRWLQPLEIDRTNHISWQRILILYGQLIQLFVVDAHSQGFVLLFCEEYWCSLWWYYGWDEIEVHQLLQLDLSSSKFFWRQSIRCLRYKVRFWLQIDCELQCLSGGGPGKASGNTSGTF